MTRTMRCGEDSIDRGESYGRWYSHPWPAGIVRSEERGNGRCVRCFSDSHQHVALKPAVNRWVNAKQQSVDGGTSSLCFPPRDIGNCFFVLSSLWRICLFGRVSVWEVGVGVLVLPHRRVVRTQQQCLSLYLSEVCAGLGMEVAQGGTACTSFPSASDFTAEGGGDQRINNRFACPIRGLSEASQS